MIMRPGVQLPLSTELLSTEPLSTEPLSIESLPLDDGSGTDPLLFGLP